LLLGLSNAVSLLTPPSLLSVDWSTWNNTRGDKLTWRSENGMITKNGTPYAVQGINYNGIESGCGAPLGLFDKPLSFFLDTAANNGFNSIRLPVPYEVMKDLDNTHVQDCVSAEPSLYPGMSSADMLQVVLDEAHLRNLSVLIDLHTIGGVITEYPWTDQVLEDDVVRAWMAFLKRFGEHPALMGVEIKNEPHNSITLERFLEHCALVIYNVEAQGGYTGLYFISGVQVGGSAWGGSYEGEALQSASFEGLTHPSVLCALNVSTDRFVLCPHQYGPDVRGQGAAQEGPETWERAYGFITEMDGHWNSNAIVPTEYGGFMWPASSDRDFFERWLKWTRSKNMSAGGYMWTLAGAFSADTGGVLDEGYNLRYDKVDFCRRLVD
jgi:hypothetical protein